VCGLPRKRSSSAATCRWCVKPKRRINSVGYVDLWRPGHPLARKDGYLLEHRLVLHEAGVEIPKGAHVHHRNGDKTDNRIENLAVLSPRQHTNEHIPIGTLVTNQYGRFPRWRSA